MISFSELFIKDTKRLIKKYPLIKNDIKKLIKNLKENPKIGVSLGDDLFKIRISNSSVPTGKSGGFRVIIYLSIENNRIILMRIYSKTEKDEISDKELKEILENVK